MKINFTIPFFLATPALCLGMPHSKQDDQDRPNILFCIADDASFHHFSKAGCSWVSTPNFDRVAEDGIFFENCYTPNAKSAPSRAILLTGKYSWQLEEAGNHLCNFPTDLKVFTEALEESGYDVAYTGKGWAPGNPGIIEGKPRQLTGKPYQKYKTDAPTKCINKCDYARNFADFLNHTTEGKPWFFWYGCTEPHRRYEYGTGVSVGGKTTEMIEDVPEFWPDNEIVRNDMLDYGLEIEYYDRHIGKMLDELEKRDMLDNTIIIITSDNGMPFPRCKANNYEYAHHMPCAVMWKNGIKNPGRKVDSYISFIDIAPTILDAAGVNGERFGMQKMSGKSIIPILKDKISRKELKERKEIILGRERDDYGRPMNQGYPIRAIIKDQFLYIWNIKPYLYPAGNIETGYLDIDGSPTKSNILELKRKGIDTRFWELSFGLRPEFELYNLAMDPYCIHNLVGYPEMQDIIKALSSRLIEKLSEQGDPRLGKNGDIFDSYNYDTEDKWNFYENVVNGTIKEPWKQTGWVNPTDYEAYPKK